MSCCAESDLLAKAFTGILVFPSPSSWGFCMPVLFKKQVLLNDTSLMLLMLGLQEKVKRMTPEQRAKFKAREERVQTKRAMKQRMIRA